MHWNGLLFTDLQCWYEPRAVCTLGRSYIPVTAACLHLSLLLPHSRTHSFAASSLHGYLLACLFVYNGFGDLKLFGQLFFFLLLLNFTGTQSLACHLGLLSCYNSRLSICGQKVPGPQSLQCLLTGSYRKKRGMTLILKEHPDGNFITDFLIREFEIIYALKNPKSRRLAWWLRG